MYGFYTVPSAPILSQMDILHHGCCVICGAAMWCPRMGTRICCWRFCATTRFLSNAALREGALTNLDTLRSQPRTYLGVSLAGCNSKISLGAERVKGYEGTRHRRFHGQEGIWQKQAIKPSARIEWDWFCSRTAFG